ncbi:MAG: nucleotide sugar dehydrogenase, partial [Alphaproteobacteria bacterium]|nr:nucleotide sugar dehydrogenase [Alphaproteobacteria bacterium]
MTRIAVVGLGYVGLPLAVAFGRVAETVGIDLSADKIEHFRNGVDPTGEMSPDELRAAAELSFTTEFDVIADVDYVIVAVPTPIDSARRPDFAPLLAASRSVGRHMRKGATVVYESTVYPGATEEVCLPVLEDESGLTWRKDFHLGYSPERINPGDTDHSLEKIVKVVAGDDDDTLERVAALYGQIIEAGTYRAPSIRVAEAAKVIENTQRDLNIALMNELAIIFDRAGLDTMDILETAKTKWNFLPFRPGLVGGHCIGVDPYYLTYKAEALDYHPQVILAGRRINDGMSVFVAEQTVKSLVRAGSAIHGATVNVLGVTFKENVADIRNSKVFDLIRELESYKIEVNVHDPVVSELPNDGEGGHLTLRAWEDLPPADATIVAVAHRVFLECPLDELVRTVKPGGCFIDVQS